MTENEIGATGYRSGIMTPESQQILREALDLPPGLLEVQIADGSAVNVRNLFRSPSVCEPSLPGSRIWPS